VVANAVADPGTVVVHLGDADVANTAVVSPLRFPVAAVLAVHFLVGRWRLGDHFNPLKSGHSVGKQRHEHQEVEEHLDQLEVDLVRHPFIHLEVHQVGRHHIEAHDYEPHHENEDARYHVVTEKATEQTVAKHAHGYVFFVSGNILLIIRI